MNIKKKSLLLLLISLFIFFTSLVFFVIGCNSHLLVKKTLKYISLILTILSFILIVLSIVLLIKHHHRRGFKKVSFNILTVLVSMYAVGCTSFLIILYGPYNGFRDWLITTAMQTMRHQYYCKWFYSDDDINKVLASNYIEEVDENTDTSLINHETTTSYANEYEREILEHEEGALYKVIRFQVNNCNAYLGVIYDPSKVSVGVTKDLFTYGHYVYKMAQEQNAVLAINGGGFIDNDPHGSTPIGITISDGKLLTDTQNSNGSGGVIGFTNDNNLVLLRGVTGKEALDMGVRDAVTMGPFLIVNGKASFISGNGGWGKAARTAIGQRSDGIVLFLVVDSNEFRTNGATMADLTKIMQNYGAINAANLDGGTSSGFVENGVLLNDPIDSTLAHKTRGIPTFFKVVE